MGACQHCQHSEEVPALDNQAKAEYAAAKVDEAKEAVEAKTEELKEAVESKVEEIKEYVETVAEEIAAAENAADAPVVAVVEKSDAAEAKPEECKEAAEAKPEECKELAEKVEKVEKVDKFTPLVLLLAKKKGQAQSVEFTYKSLGFEFEDAPVKTGCCGRASKRTVRVSKVEAGQQAATLGVEQGATIYQANGKDIADASQLKDLITEHLTKLPEAAASN